VGVLIRGLMPGAAAAYHRGVPPTAGPSARATAGPPRGPATGVALQVRGLTRRFGGRVALDGLDLDVPAGAVTALLGPNGAGKTTAVECCTGLRRADAGTVLLLGTPVHGRLPAALRARVGVTLQDGGLPSAARPMALLRHLARLHARPADVDALAARLGVDTFARTPVRRLSGGQRRRLAVAAALVGRPDLVVLDEPGAGLDVPGRAEVSALVRDLAAAGTAVVLTTHDLEEAERLADHVVVVAAGRAVAAGPPAALTGRSGDRAALRFSAPPRLDLASLRRALPEGSRVAESGSGRYLVEGVVDPSVVATVTSWCATHGVLAHELSVGRQTLADVVGGLTGTAVPATAGPAPARPAAPEAPGGRP
jgi:ABC-2 type transport system ATP-binding protein